eukprot:8855214-Pyramimonas_sp.AAC.1
MIVGAVYAAVHGPAWRCIWLRGLLHVVRVASLRRSRGAVGLVAVGPIAGIVWSGGGAVCSEFGR